MAVVARMEIVMTVMMSVIVRVVHVMHVVCSASGLSSVVVWLSHRAGSILYLCH